MKSEKPIIICPKPSGCRNPEMSESIFDTVKAAVPMRECIEALGFVPNRAGYICCPFHSERTASLKLYDDSFHCFGCGAGGDVIEFYKQYKRLDSSGKAARELAQLFHVHVDGIRLTAHSKPIEAPKPTAGQLQAFYKQWLNEAFCGLRGYCTWCEIILRELHPKTPAAELHPLFVEAIQNRDFVEYALDVLAGGTDAKKKDLFTNFRGEVERLVIRYRQITNDY